MSMIRIRWPVGGMILNGRKVGSPPGSEVSVGTGSGEFHISMKSAPIAGPRIGWSCGGMPSDRTTDLPPASCPVTTRRPIPVMPRSPVQWRGQDRPRSVPLEVLDFALVLLGRLAAAERAEIAALAGLRVLLARIEP